MYGQTDMALAAVLPAWNDFAHLLVDLNLEYYYLKGIAFHRQPISKL